ncbi:hypothetical protein CCAX7_000490 [Capsulimonas corticalis]|uniref:Uncharacterized protein n=1 Tax=Capsulimonas corticalis TaxID=2219043 RepID=A0A402CR72_9BACT|nr:phage portal protein [Capsulimonas corticalis]BDI27998.1 hypothetical protein CCAX7_000490 [Capsulimonas corticalis]
MTTRAEQAAALINTRSLPVGLGWLQDKAAEAHAYDVLNPYPLFHFKEWKTEDRGPLPRCMPLAKSIIARGAKWLFGQPLQIHCAENPDLEEFLRKMWRKNKMGARLVAMARQGGCDGGIALKFSYDETARIPLSIQSLSLVDEVRLYYDPHNCADLLMARIQYSYFDAVAGKTMWYREEWTDDEEIHYFPLPQESLNTSLGSTRLYMSYNRTDPDTYEGWKISSRAANPFGVIPLTHIKNVETDDLYGAGDLWDLYRVLDRINLTYHLMDKSNQFDAESNPIFIDLDLDEDDIDKPLQPGQPIDAHSAEGEKQGKVEFPPTGNGLRPAMMEYAKDLKKQILAAASSVEVDQSEFSNKGNLTNAVLAQLYLPQIELTEEKRKSWGEDGLCEFLALVARGLQNVGVDLGVREDDEDSYDVTLAWPPYFQMSQDELTALTGRTQEQEIAGYITHERAIERVAQAEGIEDVTALIEELKTEPPPPAATPTAADASLQQTEQEIAGLKGAAGKSGV